MARRLVKAKLATTEKSGRIGVSRSRGSESDARRDGSLSGVAWMPLFSIAAAAFAVEIPFFFFGVPSGHDVEFHLYSWLEVVSQWKQGIIYPRWAALGHFAYGEPRFIFYPPASWTLGSALSAMFPWVATPGIYIWVVLILAGVSMFLLSRQWLDRRDATFAAVLYAANPYHIVIVYWRSAFAELLASSLLPLLLLLLLRADEKGRRVCVLLAVVLGGAWLVNAPAALMVHYSLGLLMLVIAWQRRSARVLVVGSAAVALGAALAAFYLLPAVYEQRWVNISEAVSAGSRPLDNFLFVHTQEADHDAFNHLISWVAMAEILLTFVAAWATRGWGSRNCLLWYLLVTWAATCAVLMLPVTTPLWSILPKLRFMQFPWRWLLCLGVPFTLLITLGTRRWTSRIALYVASVCFLVFVGQHFQSPWWDTAADMREMQENMATGAGYEGTDEYTPLGGDASSISKDARRVTVEGSAHAAIHVSQWNPELKTFTAEMSAPDDLALRLFNYPAWRIEVNGQEVQASTRKSNGQMLIPVGAGANRVQLTFVHTWDRKAGAWISGIALLFTLFSLRKAPVVLPPD
jgi:hypothetical protein